VARIPGRRPGLLPEFLFHKDLSAMEPQYTPPHDAQRELLQSRGPVRVVIEQPRFSWLGTAFRWGFTILLALLVIGAMQGGYGGEDKLQEKWHSLSKTAREKIAIIAIEGTIMGHEGFAKKQIDQVRDDENVRAIVVRVDSPGGTVTGSDYLYHHLKKLAADKRIPLVVSMGGIAASGGYYVAMAAGDTPNTIFAEPTTWTGSIGVIIPHYDVSDLLEKWSIKDDSIASNPLKMMGSPTRKFTEAIRAEEQLILQGLVDSSFNGFKDIVLSGRPALRDKPDLQNVVFTGRIFTAKQAQENLLVDKLGFVEDAIDRAIELAKLDKDEVQVVKYQRSTGLLDLMLFGQQNARQSLDLAALADLAVPRAYYLCTWLPGIGSLQQE
jgi:protease-4